jgi:hypothetical protein
MTAHTPIRPPVTLGKLMNPAHLLVTRDLGYVLTIGDPGAWADFATIARAKLTAPERAAMAWAALTALDHDDALTVATSFLPDQGAGAPMAPFDTVTAEAANWAAMACEAELAAYARAAFEALPKARQAGFLRHYEGAVK